jgi:hypothetical protein
MFKAKLEMKTKLFLAAVAVAFSFAVTSCGNKKAANTEVEATEVEVVEEVQACDSTKACCKADAAACDSTKACCKEKKECDKACDKK